MQRHQATAKALKVVDELLGRSDHDRTYRMLNEVGIDLSSRSPIKRLIDRLDRQLDKLELLLNSKE